MILQVNMLAFVKMNLGYEIYFSDFRTCELLQKLIFLIPIASIIIIIRDVKFSGLHEVQILTFIYFQPVLAAFSLDSCTLSGFFILVCLHP